MVQWYQTSFPTDNASMQGLTQSERELLFVCQTCQTKQTTLLNYFTKQPIYVYLHTPQVEFNSFSHYKDQWQTLWIW